MPDKRKRGPVRPPFSCLKPAKPVSAQFHIGLNIPAGGIRGNDRSLRREYFYHCEIIAAPETWSPKKLEPQSPDLAKTREVKAAGVV
ncbi:hypothetical protein GCM10010873_35590 [Cypionkella aquatica]|uniref:Uncharacterized protein n=1 Tax=Cypionkella aquatica TaxID=1756042 RepID=A0AA37U7Z1_9RHOB|nr:hypothetical protein GCM10010873_35590 [Cypionkella aquatica]